MGATYAEQRLARENSLGRACATPVVYEFEPRLRPLLVLAVDRCATIRALLALHPSFRGGLASGTNLRTAFRYCSEHPLQEGESDTSPARYSVRDIDLPLFRRLCGRRRRGHVCTGDLPVRPRGRGAGVRGTEEHASPLT